MRAFPAGSCGAKPCGSRLRPMNVGIGNIGCGPPILRRRGIRNGEEVLVEQGEAFSLSDIVPKILEPFIAQLVLVTQVCASGGAVAGDCKVRFELTSALLTNFEVESLRVHNGTCGA